MQDIVLLLTNIGVYATKSETSLEEMMKTICTNGYVIVSKPDWVYVHIEVVEKVVEETAVKQSIIRSRKYKALPLKAVNHHTQLVLPLVQVLGVTIGSDLPDVDFSEVYENEDTLTEEWNTIVRVKDPGGRILHPNPGINV